MTRLTSFLLLSACLSLSLSFAAYGQEDVGTSAVPDFGPSHGNCASGPDTCTQGYVWREATRADHVCVSPEIRDATQADNAAAASRRNPNGGPYGPNTCLSGFVWREATPSDHICVSPDTRDAVRAQNRRPLAHRACRH